MEEKIKVIIDTDLGDDIDDAFAIALTTHLKNVEILGITTVYRNVDLRSKIVLAIKDMVGGNFPVIAGHDTPLVQPVKYFNFEQKQADGRPIITHYDESMEKYTDYTYGAEDFILDTADKYKGEVVLISLGPATNVAKAIQKSPERFNNLKELLIMGGDPSLERAEWNVRCDPEAFDIMMKCPLKKTIVGLDITNQCAINSERLERIFALDGDLNKLVVKMLKRWISDRPTKTPTMHDPLTTALLGKSFCQFEDASLRISLEGEDRGKSYKIPSETDKLAVSVDSGAFLDWMIEKLGE